MSIFCFQINKTQKQYTCRFISILNINKSHYVLGSFSFDSICCCLNSSINCSVALDGKNGVLDNCLFGNCDKFNSGSLNVKGVHGPWIDGESVCHNFRNLKFFELPDWVLSSSSHFKISSRATLAQETISLSPFTVISHNIANEEKLETLTYNILQKLKIHDAV